MIAKGKAIAHGGNALNYAMREGKMDRIVGRNMIDSDNPANILRELEMVNQHNYRCKNKFMRYEIGIAPQDVDNLKQGDMSQIARTFANKMGLQNHQWIACTHKDTDKPHIHLIANRIGVDSKVFDTTFMSNRSAQIAEEISHEMGLTIANDIRKQKQHQEAYTAPTRQQAKEKLQNIAYSELDKNTTLMGFLHGLEQQRVGIEPAKNKQNKTYGIRFGYEGQTFKASEIGREFGFHSIAKNFSSSSKANHSQQEHKSPAIGSLLSDLLSASYIEGDNQNELNHRKKIPEKKNYGQRH